MRDARVFCPECNWNDRVESGTEDFPFYCPRTHSRPVRTEVEVETMNYLDYHTQTDKA